MAANTAAKRASIESGSTLASLCSLTRFITNSPEILTISKTLTPAKVSALCSLLGSPGEISHLTLQEELPACTGAALGSAISASAGAVRTLTLGNKDAFMHNPELELLRMLAAISANPAATLEHLTIINIDLMCNRRMCDSLWKFTTLRSLTVQESSSSYFRFSIPLFAASIVKLQLLDSLNLQGIVCYSSDDTETLVAALKALPRLDDLGMRRDDLRAEAGRPIGGLVALSRILKLDLRHNMLCNEGVSAMVEATLRYKHCSMLQVLKLSDNNMDSSGGLKLMELIARSPDLRTLDLSRNLVGKALHQLSAAVGRSLRKLGLNKCNLGPEGIESIMDVLCAFPALSVLRINENGVWDQGARGAAAILDALATASTLPMETIQLADCEIEDDGASAVGRLIARRACKDVDLERNKITVTGAKAIANSIAVSKCVIHKMNLTDNPLKEE